MIHTAVRHLKYIASDGLNAKLAAYTKRHRSLAREILQYAYAIGQFFMLL